MTSIVSVAVCPFPPVIVKMQWPAATGVTVKIAELVVGEIVAMPLHEFVCPAAAVEAVNVPP